MKTKFFLFFNMLVLLFPITIWANGGPIDISHFRKTGNIRLLNKAEVSLVKEDLHLKVVGDYTEIEVDYLLKNNGKDQIIQYGFPVDAYETDWHYGEPKGEIFSLRNDPVDYFRIFEDGKKVKSIHWVVDSLYSAQTTNLKEGIYYKKAPQTIARKWQVVNLDCKKGETKKLRVEYKIKNTMRDISPGFCFVPRFTERHFTYHLTPSSNWGNGIIQEFNLTVDLTDLEQTGASYRLTGVPDWNPKQSTYTWNVQNYDLKQSGRIEIHYDNQHLLMSQFLEESALPKKIINSFKSSSNTASLPFLFDKSPRTSWTGQEGDWIEFTLNRLGSTSPFPKDQSNLQGILVLNGDYANEEQFNASGKLAAVRVIINDTLLFNTEMWDEEGSRLIIMDRPLFRSVGQTHWKGLASIIADGDGLTAYRTIPQKVRIEIVKVDGKAGKKVSLSEIYLVGF